MSETTKWKVKVRFPSNRVQTLKIETPNVRGTDLFFAVHQKVYDVLKHTEWRVSKIEKVSEKQKGKPK